MTRFVPLLTEGDPAVSSEGAIDPLGLYTIADSLGSKLAPGVRERQSRPRWLTAIAAGMLLCEDFPEETVATDDVSEPWQVFEWYVVEGLVRTASDDDDLTRLPGLRKARQSVQDRVPLSAPRYLKAPSVYGFHGVYRTLARAIGVDATGRLGEHNVRLVNGATRQETRQRLMLTFNTPFYPEILIASSVMAEGVDLHLNCRHIIHHDLCWNPSMLEQRTGRIDRIGAKVERCGKPIRIYLPFVAETQDEKMYRVVLDRERWFNIVMGEKIPLDARTTDKLADRVPLRQAIADTLQFRLEVARA